VVTFVYTYTIESRETVDLKILSKIKKMLYFVHQNFLIKVQLIIERLPEISKESLWAHSLQAVLLNKKSSAERPLLAFRASSVESKLDYDHLELSIRMNN